MIDTGKPGLINQECIYGSEFISLFININNYYQSFT